MRHHLVMVEQDPWTFWGSQSLPSSLKSLILTKLHDYAKSHVMRAASHNPIFSANALHIWQLRWLFLRISAKSGPTIAPYQVILYILCSFAEFPILHGIMCLLCSRNMHMRERQSRRSRFQHNEWCVTWKAACRTWNVGSGRCRARGSGGTVTRETQ